MLPSARMGSCSLPMPSLFSSPRAPRDGSHHNLGNPAGFIPDCVEFVLRHPKYGTSLSTDLEALLEKRGGGTGLLSRRRKRATRGNQSVYHLRDKFFRIFDFEEWLHESMKLSCSDKRFPDFRVIYLEYFPSTLNAPFWTLQCSTYGC